MLHNLSRFLLFIPLALVLSACPIDEDDDEDANDGSLSVSLVLKDQFGQEEQTFTLGEIITFEASITNAGTETQTLSFGTPCLADFTIKEADGVTIQAELFRLSNGTFCVQMAETVTLDPDETHVYSYEWNQEDDNGNPVVAGDYVVTTWFAAPGGDLFGDEATAELFIQ